MYAWPQIAFRYGYTDWTVGTRGMLLSMFLSVAGASLVYVAVERPLSLSLNRLIDGNARRDRTASGAVGGSFTLGAH
jgi:hypothetical protein